MNDDKHSNEPFNLTNDSYSYVAELVSKPLKKIVSLNKLCLYFSYFYFTFILQVFSIPGIPTPNLSGILTNIKPHAMPLFSLPGKRVDMPNLPNHPVGHDSPRPVKPIPFVLGIPGPYSHQSTLTTDTLSPGPSKPFLLSPPLRTSTVHQQKSPNNTTVATAASCQIKIEVSESSPIHEAPSAPASSDDSKFLRPNSLPLTPGSFKMKKQIFHVNDEYTSRTSMAT